MYLNCINSNIITINYYVWYLWNTYYVLALCYTIIHLIFNPI